jgi:hypothetical protein
LEVEDIITVGAPEFPALLTEPLIAAPDRDRAPFTILCLGNAVSRELVQIVRSFPAFSAVFRVRLAKDVHSGAAILASISDRERSQLAGVWEQVSLANGNTVDLRDFLPPSAVYVRFPHLSLSCLWPLQGEDPKARPEALYPGGRYPYTDIAGIQLRDASLNMSDDDLYDAYLELSSRLMPDLDENWTLDESRSLALDSYCDVKVTKFLSTNFERERLFYSPELPCAPLLLYVAEHLIGSVLPRMQLQPSALYREFLGYAHGYQGMFYDQAPMHPQVLEHFRVPGVSLDYEYRREYSRRTFRDHMLDYIRWAPWFAGERATEVGLR